MLAAPRMRYAINCLANTTWERTRATWWEELARAVELQPDLGAELLSLCRRHSDPKVQEWAVAVSLSLVKRG